MKTYRALVLTLEGQIIHSVDLVCATEENARALAERLAENNPVELWDGARRIALFEPKKTNRGGLTHPRRVRRTGIRRDEPSCPVSGQASNAAGEETRRRSGNAAPDPAPAA